MSKTKKSVEERAKELAEHKNVREKVFMDYMHNESNSFKENVGNHKNNTSHKQIQGSGFFSQDNVKEYQKRMVTHSFGKDAPKKKGRGTFFESVEECEEWMIDFFNLCAETEIVPTVSGLACWLKCDPHTITNHAGNPNSPFCTICSQALAICHSALEVGASESKLGSVPYIFQAKNYFGMKDEQQVTIGGTVNHELINSSDSLNALRSQINEEKQIEAREAIWEEVSEENNQKSNE